MNGKIVKRGEGAGRGRKDRARTNDRAEGHPSRGPSSSAEEEVVKIYFVLLCTNASLLDYLADRRREREEKGGRERD